MEIFDFKCKCCGGGLEAVQGLKSVGKCKFCGSKQTLPKLHDQKRANLFDRANHLRRNNEFDKAEALYEQILNEDSSDPEAYWSLVLCRYGIEYVKDVHTGKMIPTVNRAQMTSIYADEDYKSAIANADEHQKELYEEEAAIINEIEKGILEISKNEEPFDVFICYKESDEKGERTRDSVLAQELYQELTRNGYKVFFSRVTLRGKLGNAYEPYIFSALNSAKVMVVIGTKKEYFEAVWVRNEWSRFLAQIKNGAKKSLIPAFRDMDAYNLPKDFANLQALNMSRIGFMQELVDGIESILKQHKRSPKVMKAAHSAPNNNISNTEGKKTIKLLIGVIAAAAIIVAAIIVGVSLFDNSKEPGNEIIESENSQNDNGQSYVTEGVTGDNGNTTVDGTNGGDVTESGGMSEDSDDQTSQNTSGEVAEESTTEEETTEEETTEVPREKYTVTYNSNGGTAVDSEVLYFGEKPVKPDAPRKAGYDFLGWFSDESLTTEYKFDKALDKDTTFYAKFEYNTLYEDYIVINNAEDLKKIADDPTANYLLGGDINLKGDIWTPIETFSGVLDGYGFKIYNFVISSSAYKLGLIIENNGTIQNLVLDVFDISHSADIAREYNVCLGILTAINKGTINNCMIGSKGSFKTSTKTYANAEINGCPSPRIGALTGDNYGAISGCIVQSEMNIDYSHENTWKRGQYLRADLIGGAVGFNNLNSVVTQTLVENEIICTIKNTHIGGDQSYTHPWIGGIVGKNDGSVSQCMSKAVIDVQYTCGGTDGLSVAGIAAECKSSTSVVEDCISGGSIKVTNANGGIDGSWYGAVSQNSGIIRNIYSCTDINVGDCGDGGVGGLAAHNMGGAAVLKSVYSGKIVVSSIARYGMVTALQEGTTHLAYYSKSSAIVVDGNKVTEAYAVGTAEALKTINTKAFIFETLYWDPEIWSITDGSAPTLKNLPSAKE